MTDFFVLPGTRVPLGDSGGLGTSPIPGRTAPYSNPELDDGGVVQVVDAEWARRAQVARESADSLAEVARQVSRLLKSNVFGDCEEGRLFHSRIVSFVTEWGRSLANQANSLEVLSHMCKTAQGELTETDRAAASDIEA
ncbi:hypothetical protein ACLQ3C_10235 [Gordonia sp. DT30]|uniref:hypothetical protein n=1 Tax=Gordonia sp. DT30 TaxID=3416546 RepID=UPI003CF6952F